MRDPTRGGLSSALNELAAASRVGVKLDEAAIPLRPEVRGACEMLGLDPLYVANEGKLIAVVPPEDADRVLAAMRAHPLGRNAAIIGRSWPRPRRHGDHAFAGGRRARGDDAGGRTTAADLLNGPNRGLSTGRPDMTSDLPPEKGEEPEPKKASGQILRHEVRRGR